MSDLKKDALNKFKREYPRTEKGLLNRVHGYYYLKYAKMYIYNIQKGINKFKPVPDNLQYPKGKDNELVEDVVKMFSDQSGFASARMETNDYHAKIVRVDDAKKILELHEELNLPDLPKTVIPYDLARKAIIKDPESICVMECPCRSAKGSEGCYPRDVCILLGEPWVSFVLENVPEAKPRRITQEEALKIVQDQHELGNVQSAFFKSAMNDRLYVICNCCKCCCTAIAGYTHTHSPMFATSGYKSTVDKEKCISCGICVDVCAFNAMVMVDGEMYFNNEKCYGCGACESKCPQGAISMIRDDENVSEPLDLDVLIPRYTPKDNEK